MVPKSAVLTCVLGQARPDADLQGLTGRFQHSHVPLALDELDLPGAPPTQETPALLLQLQLQPERYTTQTNSLISPITVNRGLVILVRLTVLVKHGVPLKSFFTTSLALSRLYTVSASQIHNI